MTNVLTTIRLLGSLALISSLLTGCAQNTSEKVSKKTLVTEAIKLNNLSMTNELLDGQLISIRDFEVTNGQSVQLAKYTTNDNQLCVQYVSGFNTTCSNIGSEVASCNITTTVSDYCERSFASDLLSKQAVSENIEYGFTELKGIKSISLGNNYIEELLF